MSMGSRPRPKIKTRHKTKNELIAEATMKKWNTKLNNECSRQIDIIWHSVAIALYRYHGWTAEQINNLIAKTSQDLWQECADIDDQSMIEMLWNECGIELQSEDDSRSFFDVNYLFSDRASYGDMPLAQWVAMRQGQIKWVGAQFMACALLSIYRKEQWSDKAMGKIFSEIESVKHEFYCDPEKLREASGDIVGWYITTDNYLSEVQGA